MKKCLIFITLILFFSPKIKSTIHEILVWNGYMQFLPSNIDSVNLGDTINWLPLDPPTMTHTITSTNIPLGAIPFDEVWQLPADTFFQYIPIAVGQYDYVCTPHVPGMVGSFTVYGSPSGCIENSNQNINLFYPNPALYSLNINCNYLQFPFEIYNMQGNLINVGLTQNNLDISFLKSGIYHLIIYADKPRIKKLIVQ